jgi:hypothetical protein
MYFVDASWKGNMIMSSLTSFVRVSGMHLLGYRESDYTYLGALGTWNIAGLVAIAIYELAARMIEARQKRQLSAAECSTREKTIELA